MPWRAGLTELRNPRDPRAGSAFRMTPCMLASVPLKAPAIGAVIPLRPQGEA